MTNTLSWLSPTRSAESHPQFDALAVLCGPAARSSDLAALDRPPGMLPITSEGHNNVQRILRSVESFLSPSGQTSSARVLIEADADTVGWPDLGPKVRYIPDRSAFRGTGGVLRDACEDLDDGDRVLVMSAGEVIDGDLGSIITQIGQIDSDVVLCRDAKHRPVSIWSMRAGSLRCVSSVGYSDLKEQVLSSLSSRCDVRVVTLEGDPPRCYWLRDLAGFMGCVRALAGDPNRSFDLREPGVEVAHDALISDAVLLNGARVESGAIVARSVIGAGVTVKSGRRVIDQILATQA